MLISFLFLAVCYLVGLVHFVAVTHCITEPPNHRNDCSYCFNTLSDRKLTAVRRRDDMGPAQVRFLTNIWSRWPSESPTVLVHPRRDTLSLHMM